MPGEADLPNRLGPIRAPNFQVDVARNPKRRIASRLVVSEAVEALEATRTSMFDRVMRSTGVKQIITALKQFGSSEKTVTLPVFGINLAILCLCNTRRSGRW
jgi:hypothetical protein